MAKYDGASIQVLDDKEAVRKRPGMYIGGTDSFGYHHLLWEALDNSCDEALNGHATRISVILGSDRKTITIKDDGRGIPTDIHPKLNVSAAEVIFTVLHAGGKFDQDSYKAAGGLHGVGASVMNFLSESLRVSIQRDGKVHAMSFEAGIPKAPLQVVRECPKKETGTEVTFKPDPEIFGNLSFDPDIIRERLEIKTFLNKGLAIEFHFEDETNLYYHEEGIKEYLNMIVLGGKHKATHEEPIQISQEEGNLEMDIVLQWTEDVKEDIRSYVNTIPTSGGGTHENGFKRGILAALRSYFSIRDVVPKTLEITPEDIREGLKVIVSVKVAGEIQLQGQTKDRLNNPEILGVVSGAVKTHIEQYLLLNTSVAESITERIIQAAKARNASRSASKQVRKKILSKKIKLPGKLSDCSSTDPDICELFLVEGDSAAGTSKQARDRRTQAILPLRGKILNTEGSSLSDILKNREVRDIIEALGCGIGKDFDINGLRYGKIILLMDADSDGHHITTLLLTLFYRHLPKIIEEGHLFLAQPPLYKILVGDEVKWALTDAEKERILSEAGNKKVDISRFKGLGEMMGATLKETTLDPNTRTLLEVEAPPDGGETDRVVTILMGKEAKERYDFIMANMENLEDLDI